MMKKAVFVILNEAQRSEESQDINCFQTRDSSANASE